MISINIDYKNSESVVEKTYVDGQLESTSPAKINFDFKDTKSKFTIVTFGPVSYTHLTLPTIRTV